MNPVDDSLECAPAYLPRARPWMPSRGVPLDTSQGRTPAVFQGWFCTPELSQEDMEMVISLKFSDISINLQIKMFIYLS